MSEILRRDPMMARLLDALRERRSIGHYGRLVFTMVARYFLGDEEVARWLRKDPECDAQQARALVRQVKEHRYSPPTREKILEFQQHQAFPIIPSVHDPDFGNVYRTLRFPPPVYAHIEDYYEDKVAAQGAAEPSLGS